MRGRGCAFLGTMIALSPFSFHFSVWPAKTHEICQIVGRRAWFVNRDLSEGRTGFRVFRRQSVCLFSRTQVISSFLRLLSALYVDASSRRLLRICFSPLESTQHLLCNILFSHIFLLFCLWTVAFYFSSTQSFHRSVSLFFPELLKHDSSYATFMAGLQTIFIAKASHTIMLSLWVNVFTWNPAIYTTKVQWLSNAAKETSTYWVDLKSQSIN